MNEAAVRIAANVTVTRQRLGLARSLTGEERWNARLAALRDSLASDAFLEAWNEAWDQWETDDAIRHALGVPAEPVAGLMA